MSFHVSFWEVGGCLLFMLHVFSPAPDPDQNLKHLWLFWTGPSCAQVAYTPAQGSFDTWWHWEVFGGSRLCFPNRDRPPAPVHVPWDAEGFHRWVLGANGSQDGKVVLWESRSSNELEQWMEDWTFRFVCSLFLMAHNSWVHDHPMICVLFSCSCCFRTSNKRT